MPKSSGFTLIELLVVIAVIGVLVTVLIVIIDPLTQFKKSRDAVRKQELKQLQVAVQAYYADNGHFPCWDNGNCYSNADVWHTDEASTSRWGLSSYINPIPVDPTRNTGTCQEYMLAANNDGSSYVLLTRLENSKDPDVTKAKKAIATAIGTSPDGNKTITLSSGVGSCKDKIFNYWITNPD